MPRVTFSVIKSINTGRATVRRRATEEASERGSAQRLDPARSAVVRQLSITADTPRESGRSRCPAPFSQPIRIQSAQMRLAPRTAALDINSTSAIATHTQAHPFYSPSLSLQARVLLRLAVRGIKSSRFSIRYPPPELSYRSPLSPGFSLYQSVDCAQYSRFARATSQTDCELAFTRLRFCSGALISGTSFPARAKSAAVHFPLFAFPSLFQFQKQNHAKVFFFFLLSQTFFLYHHFYKYFFFEE